MIIVKRRQEISDTSSTSRKAMHTAVRTMKEADGCCLGASWSVHRYIFGSRVISLHKNANLQLHQNCGRSCEHDKFNTQRHLISAQVKHRSGKLNSVSKQTSDWETSHSILGHLKGLLLQGYSRHAPVQRASMERQIADCQRSRLCLFGRLPVAHMCAEKSPEHWADLSLQ